MDRWCGIAPHRQPQPALVDSRLRPDRPASDLRAVGSRPHQVIVDRAVSTGSVQAILTWVSVLAALFVVLTLVYRYGARLLMFAIARESHLLRVELSRKVLHPLGITTDFQTGELLSISSTDSDETSYVLDYVPRVTGAVVATITCGAILLGIDVPLGLMVLIGVPMVVAGLQITAPLIARRVEDQQAAVGRASALATDLISGQRPLQGIGAQRNAAQRYRAASRRSLQATLRAARIQSLHEGLPRPPARWPRWRWPCWRPTSHCTARCRWANSSQ